LLKVIHTDDELTFYVAIVKFK